MHFTTSRDRLSSGVLPRVLHYGLVWMSFGALLPACGDGAREQDGDTGGSSGVMATGETVEPQTGTTLDVPTSTTQDTSTSETTTVPTSTGTDTTTMSTTTDFTTGEVSATDTGGSCGDGMVDDGEECDDMNAVDGDECTNMCLLPPKCGDGRVQPPEECDDGPRSESCDADCTFVACGDNTVNAVAGEECDDGDSEDSDACSSECKATAVLDVAMGYQHLCVLLSGGALRCWGDNTYGQLGRGDTLNQGDDPGELPADAVPLGGVVKQAMAGVGHTCAALAGGDDVRCWGRSNYGQLGYGNTASLGDQVGEMPPPDVNVGADILAVSLGEVHSCALTTGGKVRCWGRNKHGELGYGHSSDLFAPNLSDVPGIAEVEQLALGAFYSCVLQSDGVVRCWGENVFAQLGQGNLQWLGDEGGEMPPAPINLGGVATQIATGYVHACVRMQNGQVRCWGHGQYGKLGNGSQDTVGDGGGEMPPEDVALGGPAKEVVAGADHSCALLETGKVKCWGRGGDGALGNASTTDIIMPAQFPPPDVDLGGEATRIWSHLGKSTCALLTDGSLRCWGLNSHGQLGYGHTDNIGDDETPASAGPVPF